MTTDADAPASTRFRGSLIVWGIVIAVIGYPLSIGPVMITLMVLDKAGVPSDALEVVLKVVYTPLEYLVNRYEFIRVPLESYMQVWGWLAESVGLD